MRHRSRAATWTWNAYLSHLLYETGRHSCPCTPVHREFGFVLKAEHQDAPRRVQGGIVHPQRAYVYRPSKETIDTSGCRQMKIYASDGGGRMDVWKRRRPVERGRGWLSPRQTADLDASLFPTSPLSTFLLRSQRSNMHSALDLCNNVLGRRAITLGP